MAQRRFLNSAIVACSETKDGNKDIPSFDSLPNDIIVNILLRLPAQILYNSARFVCRTWAEISQLPSFIKSHQLHSDCGFLIQESRSPNNAQCVHIREWELKVTDLNRKFPGKISGSANGVLLINRSDSILDLYVANPVTMQVLKLPCLPSTCRLCGHCNNIASISSTGEIKVVSLCREPNGTYNWYALTVGNDMAWRKISNTAAECDPASYLSFVQSLSADGVIYWTNSSWITNQSVLAIDLRDETAHNLKVPAQYNGEYWTLVQMGRNMGFMNCGKNVDMKVWMLKDLHINEWVLVNSISFSEESPLRRKFSMPLIWLDTQVLVFSVYVKVSNAVVAYHVNKGEYKVIKIDDVARHSVFQHTNSLIAF